MQTTFAFLRAINLGQKRKFPAADIRRVTEELGFTTVRTHAASGNLAFESDPMGREKLEETLESAFEADRGFAVETITFSPAEFAAISADAHELADSEGELARHYISLLKSELDAATTQAVESLRGDRGRMVVRGRAVHALLYPGYEEGVVDPLRAAKHLGINTTRNARVIHLLTDRWAEV